MNASDATILVVDDNDMSRALVRLQLSRLGVSRVAEAADGVAALAWLAEHHCDVVLSDCQMPNMDGYTLARRIRAGEAGGAPRQPIVALTASVMDDERARCLAAGMDGHVAKPTQLAGLRAALAPWLATAVRP